MNYYGHDDNHDDDADVDDNEGINEFKIHEGIILAVHLTDSITESLTSIFSTFLKLLMTLTKTMPNTGLGLYIFNCSKEGKEHDDIYSETQEGVYRLFRLQDLNQGMLRTLDRYLSNSIPSETVINVSFNNNGQQWNKLLSIKDQNINSSFGHSLYTMLQQSLLDFNNVPTKTEEYTSKKIFLFTDCQTPFDGDINIKQKIHSKLRDLNDFKITVYPFIIESKQHDNLSIIKSKNDQIDEFRQLFDFPLDSDLESKKYLPKINEISLDKLEEKIIKHATVKRMAFQCPLIFGNLKISVKGINPFTQVEWKKIKFYNNNNRLNLVKRRTIPTSNGIEVKSEDLKKVYQIADQFIGIDDQIGKECMKFGESEKPILHIIGTLKFNKYNPSYTISKSVFMIADDDGEYDESLEKFSALYKSLCKKKLMALCWGMPRKISYPRLYYLIPTSIIDTFGLTFEKYPQSLAVIELPFGNEIRKAPDYIQNIDAISELDEDANKLDILLNAATVDKFSTLPNPSLSWKFKVMEDHILQREVHITENDSINSYTEQQLEMDEMYQMIINFKEKIKNDENLTNLVNDLTTRYNRVLNFNELKRINDEANDPMPKRSKGAKSKATGSLTDAKAVIFYKEFGLKNCTNDILREFISSKGGIIKMGKNKGEMIANIHEYLVNNKLVEETTE